MADYRAGESTGELGTPCAGKQNKSLKKKKDGDMPKEHKRPVKDASNGHVGDNCSNKIMIVMNHKSLEKNQNPRVHTDINN